MRIVTLVSGLLGLSLLGMGVLLAAAPRMPTRLAAGGKALVPVVVSEAAPERVKAAARTLADYLGRISGATFTVVPGDGSSGIAVGLPAHFPAVAMPGLGDARDPTRGEDYLLRSHERGVYVLGVTEQAVEHAVWDLLYRLGHRQFFPGATWEVIPSSPELQLAVDVQEHPAYYSRRIWYGYGPWDYAAQPYADWCARNRATSGITLHTGHAYDGILQRHRAEFAAHPEYLALVNGVRTGNKFCIANPALRKLVVEDALAQFRNNPTAPSISLEPSDGGGWCTCGPCQALGSVSDRALLLANDVATAINAQGHSRYVDLYAYSEHSPPPTRAVHPRVVVSVATAFIRGGYNVEQLLDGWHRRGATLGIREYYSVHTWDRDLPGAARGANLAYLQTTIPQFHARGARFLSAESSDNWGPNGLGYYVAARLLWDVREASRVEALVADFLEKAFGPAREPMAAYYRLLNGARKPLLSDDLVGRMYRHLAEARQRTDDPKIRRRINDLVLYTRYVDLWLAYATAEGPARQQAFEALIRHGYRMRTTMLIHAKALYRDLPARDRSVTVPKECAWNVPEGKNPWKSSTPFTEEEVSRLVTEGIAAHRLLDFEPAAFSTRLVPAPRPTQGTTPAGSMGLYSRGTRTYYTWVAKPPATLTLHVRAGLVYGNRGPARIALYPAAETEGKAVAQAEVTPDKEEHAVTLQTSFPGLHRIEVTDAGAGTAVRWPEGMPMTVASSPETPATFHGRWSLTFYVPPGTRTVGGYASGAGVLLDGQGNKVHTFAREPGYFSVPVGPGQDGRFWRFHQSAGQRLLMTVPPYLARSTAELLLPAEVVKPEEGK